jgi:hypothetical protein
MSRKSRKFMVIKSEDADYASDVNVAISCHIDVRWFLAMMVAAPAP